MALIDCPECGARISDTAPTCPKCGYDKNYKSPCPACHSTDIEKTNIFSPVLNKTFSKCRACGKCFYA